MDTYRFLGHFELEGGPRSGISGVFGTVERGVLEVLFDCLSGLSLLYCIQFNK